MRFSTLFLGLGLAGVSSVLASTNEQTAMSGSGWFSAPGKKWEWKLCGKCVFRYPLSYLLVQTLDIWIIG
jgi:hypothetical protein